MSEAQTFTIGSSAPSECDPATLAAFQTLVLQGGAVGAATFPALVQRALVLAFVRLGESIVGVGGIKLPNDSYRTEVFTKAKTTVSPAKFKYELGWIYVQPIARGNRLVSRLIRELMPALNGAAVYATARVDNAQMHASLNHCGFRLEGMPYPSKMNGPEIQLFVCE